MSQPTVEFSCVYGDQSWWFGVVYTCHVNVAVTVTEPNTKVTRITGTHTGGRENADVTAIRFDQKTLNFFPSNIETFFPNLKGIWIENCGLKKLSQSDLKPFTNLRAIWMPHNKIEVLERDLFAFNPKLEEITFINNPIRLIYPTIFDNLENLCGLRLSSLSRPIWSRDVANKNDRSGLLNLVKDIRENCDDYVYELIDEARNEAFEVRKKLEEMENDNERLRKRLRSIEGVKWEEGSVDCDLPNNALIGGLDSDGAEIVVGRALHEGVYQAAKIIKNKGRAYISYAGAEISINNFHFIVEEEEFGKFSWIPAHDGEIVDGAVTTNTFRSQREEALYIGRALYRGSMTIGKIHPSHGCLYIPYNGEEVKIEHYEVLVYEPIVI